jgi:hypothetical protein
MLGGVRMAVLAAVRAVTGALAAETGDRLLLEDGTSFLLVE